MAATATPERIDAPPHPRRGGPRDKSGSAIAFFVATGILCLHVLDDNFLQPKPAPPPPTTSSADLVPARRSPRYRDRHIRACARSACASRSRYRSDVLGIVDGRERGRLLHTARRSLRATTTPAYSRFPAGLTPRRRSAPPRSGLQEGATTACAGRYLRRLLLTARPPPSAAYCCPASAWASPTCSHTRHAPAFPPPSSAPHTRT